MNGFFKVPEKKKKIEFNLSKRRNVALVDRSKFGGIGTTNNDIVKEAELLFKKLSDLELTDRIETVNAIRQILHQYSPFNKEPVDCVQWVRTEKVVANDYNPNVVAPPEMKLLEHSVDCDGYTQPIVAWKRGKDFEVVDGFHRNRVGRESKKIQERLLGYLPLAIINSEREGRQDRMAATIRHNRARGKHHIGRMSEIIIELKRMNWTDEKIGKELGMDPDEILRLCQITGLAEIFSDKEFSEAWEFDTTVINEDDNLCVFEENIS